MASGCGRVHTSKPSMTPIMAPTGQLLQPDEVQDFKLCSEESVPYYGRWELGGGGAVRSTVTVKDRLLASLAAGPCSANQPWGALNLG